MRNGVDCKISPLEYQIVLKFVAEILFLHHVSTNTLYMKLMRGLHSSKNRKFFLASSFLINPLLSSISLKHSTFLQTHFLVASQKKIPSTEKSHSLPQHVHQHSVWSAVIFLFALPVKMPPFMLMASGSNLGTLEFHSGTATSQVRVN